MRMNRTFDILRRLLYLDIAVFQELLEHTQSVRFVVLRLNLPRRPMMQRDGAPAQSLDVLHRMTEEIFVRHSRREIGNRKVALLSPDGAVNKLDPALSNEILENCKWFVHDLT